MFLGTASHGVFSGRAQAAGHEDTLTNRSMNTAAAFFNSPGAFIASAIADRKAASQALSRADLLIRRDGVVHVFELKTQAQLADSAGRKAAAAQVADYVAILTANKVDAVAGDPTEFPQLFTGGEQTVGVVVGPGLRSKQTYNMIVLDNGTPDGASGYRLEPRANVETLTGEVLRGLANQGSMGPIIVPGPPGAWILR